MIAKSFSVITKEVSQKEIWDLATDVNGWSSWDESVEDSKIVGLFESGNYFMLKPKGSGWVKISIDEVKPSSYFRDVTKFPFAKMYGEHWYEETSEGLKITVKMTIRGLLSSLWYKIVMNGIVLGLEKDIKTQIDTIKNHRVSSDK